MSSSTDPAREPGRPFSRALLLAGMTTVLYGALLVASFGIISLVADRDVIPEPDAGPFVGIGYTGPALLVVFLAVLGGLSPSATRGVPLARAIVTGLVVFVASPVVAAAVYVVVTAQLGAFLVFTGGHLLSPFTVAAALIAFLIVLAIPGIRWARSVPR